MNIDRMCRVCEAINGLKDIFDEDNEELLHMLRRVADISVQMDDLLPKQICHNCAYRLQMAYEFKMLCELTDKTIRARLETTNLSVKVSENPSSNTDSLNVAVESIEHHTVESECDLESVIVKEEYLCNDKLEESAKESIDPLVNCSDMRLEDDHSRRCDVDDESKKEFYYLVDVVEDEVDESSNIEKLIDEQIRPIDSVESEVEKKKEKKKHLQQPKINKTYTCPICSDSVTGFREFNVHKKTHGKYPYECSMCDKKFTTTFARRAHIESVHSDSKVSCNQCNKKLCTSTLRNHIKECHGDRIQKHACSVCNKSFYRKANMIAHMETHGNERKYACDKCPLTYKTAGDRNAHKRKHKPREERMLSATRSKQKQRPFLCEHCGKQSSSQPEHINHLKIHTGAKPYTCSVCQRSFRAKLTLDLHIYTHTGEKPHTCHLCGMSFRQAPHLHTHLRSIHDQARPFKCECCGKAFTSAGNLRVHTRLHTGETPYQCNLCPLRFTTINNLKRHRRKEHENDISKKKDVSSSDQDDED